MVLAVEYPVSMFPISPPNTVLLSKTNAALIFIAHLSPFMCPVVLMNFNLYPFNGGFVVDPID